MSESGISEKKLTYTFRNVTFAKVTLLNVNKILFTFNKVNDRAHDLICVLFPFYVYWKQQIKIELHMYRQVIENSVMSKVSKY